MICKNCGANLSEDSHFCISCGQKIEKTEDPVVAAPVVEIPIEEVYEPPVVQTYSEPAPQKPKKRTGLIILVVILAVLFAASATFNVIQYLSNDELSSSVEALQNDVDDLEEDADKAASKHKTEKSELNDRIENLEAEKSELEEEVAGLSEVNEFVDEYVVFIEDDDTDWYHKFSCSRFKGDSFWVYNLNAAEYNGYEPCPYCQ